MASKMLLIITYSSIVFWLILSVTCKHIFFHKCDVFNSTTSISQSLSHCNSSCFLICSVSPSPDTTAVWDKDSWDSLSRLHKEGCPVSPSGPAEDTDAWMTMITWMNANHFHAKGIVHTPSSFARLCQTPSACWWCQSQTQTCSSGEPPGKVHRESGERGRGAQVLLKEWILWNVPH